MTKISTVALLSLALSACTVTTSSAPAEPAVPATENEAPGAETPAPDSEGSGGGACTSDADCVPAGCCHATACVIRDEAPSCADVMCTKECRYGTLDCGGSCLCQAGKCVAELSQPPAP